MQPQIFVIGSFIMGLTIKVERLPVSGETLTGRGFHKDIGGKGFNQALAASRAGGNVKLMMCIGKDDFGKAAKEMMQKEEIAADHVFELENESTGCGFVSLLESGDNAIIIDAAANNKLNAQMVRSAKDSISKSTIVMAQLEVPDEPVEEAFILGREFGCLNILNPAPARRLSLNILKNTDILTPNETEAKIILGHSPHENISIEKIAEQLLKTGVKTIVMTLGKEGALIITSKETKRIPAPTVKAIDSTGCGDCFNGNLAKALSENKTLGEAVTLAVHAGSYSAQYLGVSKGLPNAEQLHQFMNQFQNSKS
ncbi:MAG: ribokinase [Ginsengibacter sp.]